MSEPETVETRYQVISGHRRLKLIWADRLAIGILIFINGLIGAAYAAFGEPGTFAICQAIGAILAGVVFLLGRTADFIFTGRIRH